MAAERGRVASFASRPGVHGVALFLFILSLIYLSLGLRYLGETGAGLLESKIRPERIVGGGWHATLPGLERLHSLAPYLHKDRVSLVTPEGSRSDWLVSVRLHLSVEGGRRLLRTEREGSGTGLQRLAGALNAVVVRVLGEQTVLTGSPLGAEQQEQALAARLSDFGTLEGPVDLLPVEDPVSAGSLREERAREGTGTQAQQTGVRILLVGLDGADWQIIEELFKQGRLPNLRSLRRRGAWGNVRTLSPPLSPLLWTSVATGTTADRHGVVDFLARDPETDRKSPVSSRARKVRALWNIFSAFGRSVDVVAWWASWPAEKINGHMVSDRVAYSLFDFDVPPDGLGLTYPPEYFERSRPLLVGDEAIDAGFIGKFADVAPEVIADSRRRARVGPGSASSSPPLAHLAKILASTQTYHRFALDLLKKGQSDLLAVYYQGIDEVCHRFMHFAPPPMDGVAEADRRRFDKVVERFYEYQDSLIGELLRAARDDTVVIVVSDHGFKNGPDRPQGLTADIEGQPGRWHRRFGILLLAGPPISGGPFETASLLDIAPTILYLAGLPIPEDGSGRVLTKAIDADFLARFPQKKIHTYDTTPYEVAANIGNPVISAANERLLENLRSLGYIGDTAPAASTDPLSRANFSIERAEAGGKGADTVTAHTNLASVYLAQGALEGAESEISSALQLVPGFRPARQQLFLLRVQQRRYGEALRVAEDLINERDPDDPLFLARVADTYRRAGLAADGIRKFRSAFDAGRWKLGAALARLQAAGGDLSGAERTARAVLERDPVNEVAMAALFRVAEDRGNVETLEPLLKAALRGNPRSPMHLNWLAVILERRGELAAAERTLFQALEVNPDHGGALANLGGLHMLRGQEKEAIKVLERALRIDPENLEARVNLGSALAQAGRIEEAIDQFEDAVSRGMKTTGVLNGLARAYGEKGDRRTAASWLTLSLEQDPNQAHIRRLLAELRASS